MRDATSTSTPNCPKKIKSDANGDKHLIKKINDIRRTLYLLDSSIKISHSLQVEQSFKVINMRIKNIKLQRSLKDLDKKNDTMLNLFRKNITNDELPDYLTKQVNRSWHQKYDALLMLNDRLQKQIHAKNVELKEKNFQIRLLQENLLNSNEKLIEITSKKKIK